MDLAVALGEAHRLPARLLAVRVPQAVAEERRRRVRAVARKKGRMVSARRLALAAWTLLVTNVSSDRWTGRAARMRGRARWQIALLFTLWKSHGRVDESRSLKPWRILCEVYAKLLAMVGQPWLFLVSCWAYPHRSLTKAAQTVQKHALHVASAFGRLPSLVMAITTVKRCLAAGCRMNRRKKHPNNGMPERTVDTWRNFWFHTGDAGRIDERGYLCYIDRIKDTIRRRGENISSYEVEAVLLEYPGIAEVAAGAVKADEDGEDEVLVCLVLAVGAERPDPVKLLDFCVERMPYFAVPRYIEVVEEIPKTPSQKIQKNKLRERGLSASTWDRESVGYRVRRR